MKEKKVKKFIQDEMKWLDEKIASYEMVCYESQLRFRSQYLTWLSKKAELSNK